MIPHRRLLFLALIATLTGLAFAACAGDDDDDDADDSSADCETFCVNIGGCGEEDALDISSMEDCLAYCEETDSAFVDCVVNANDCDEVQDCVETATTPADTFSCEALGLTVRALEEAEDDDALYAVAADFTVPTTRGGWTLSEHWTGCETYLFILEKPSQESGWETPLWDRDVDTLIASLPQNTHVFFVSNSSIEGDREKALTGIEESVEAYTSQLDEDQQAHWFHHIHYVTKAPQHLDGWLSSVLLGPAFGVGIDRFQRIRYIGSFAHYGRFDYSRGWFAPALSMAANEAVYYNFESGRRDRIAASDPDEYVIFDGTEVSDPDWAGTRGYATITLPEGKGMDAYDTMELDLFLDCVGDGEFGTCPAWDYIAELYLCDKEDPDTCDVEFGRWITTYHREGRWVHDVSGLLPLLAGGGERRFAFYTQQRYAVTLKLLLSNHGRDTRPTGSVPLFEGGAFGPEYNDAYAPVFVDIPTDAHKVELATVITGHGGADPGNCAEFCNTTHHFTVNGEEYVLDFPEVGNQTGCMEQVAQGTVPNQFGTWWYGRSGWCPGKEVPLTMTDITADVLPGTSNQFDYDGFYEGEPYPSGGANIRMRSWVVISK